MRTYNFTPQIYNNLGYKPNELTFLTYKINCVKKVNLLVYTKESYYLCYTKLKNFYQYESRINNK